MPAQNTEASPTTAVFSNRTSYILLAVVIVLWGVNWPIIKAGLTYITPFWFAAGRVILGTVVLAVVVGATQGLKFPARKDWAMVFAIGTLQIGLYLALIHSAVAYVDAGRSVILAYSTPLWVPFLAASLLNERLSPAGWMGVVCGLSGIGLLFAPWAIDFADPNALIGNGLLLAAALVWAIAIVIVRRHPWTTSVLSLLPWQSAIGAVCLTILAFAMEGPPQIDPSPTFIAIMIYNGAIASALCFWAYIAISRSLPANSTSVGSLGVPAAGLAASAWMLGETVTLTKAAALGLIGLGIAVVAHYDIKKR